MKLERFHGLVEKLIKLEDNKRLGQKELFKIYDIIKYHYNQNHEVRTLHTIADNLIPRELKAIGKILLAHHIYLPCQICEAPVLKANHLEIDHWTPLSKGGSNFMPNTGFSHNRCNRAKDNILLSMNENGEPDRKSPEYMELEVMITIMYERETPHHHRHARTRTRPSGECNHACTFDAARMHYNNRVNSVRNRGR